ncbi:Conserved_hypothetical protein [Hexamita inflata]|uniref:Uncharacterized protein n=1 Tax=Hexamita inflata TaxID=28002 RepID=A0AA86U7I9_9EUKA|nr:Conserved hypothetical protein [Hexamita inflata]
MSTFDDILSMISTNHVKAVGHGQNNSQFNTQIRLTQQDTQPKPKPRELDSLILQKETPAKSKPSEIQLKMQQLQAKMDRPKPKPTPKQEKIEVKQVFEEKLEESINFDFDTKTSQFSTNQSDTFNFEPIEKYEPIQPVQVQKPQMQQPIQQVQKADVHQQCKRDYEQLEKHNSELLERNEYLEKQLQIVQRENTILKQQLQMQQQQSKIQAEDKADSPEVEITSKPQPPQKPQQQPQSIKPKPEPKYEAPKPAQKSLPPAAPTSFIDPSAPIPLPKQQVTNLAPKATSDFDNLWNQLDQPEPAVNLSDPIMQKQSVFTKANIQKSIEHKQPVLQLSETPIYRQNCLKILLPEQTALKEAAAKRIVSIEETEEGPALIWARQVSEQIEVSGVVGITSLINVLAAEEARMFRSKVIAARKAGYTHDIFEMIQSGIIDEIQPKNQIQSQCSVIFFTVNQVICFDFGQDKEEFEKFCGVLVEMGL